MSERKVIVNVVHQDHPNSITTVSGETSSTSSSPSVQGWIQDFREGGLNIEVISEAGGLGAQPPKSYRVF